MNVEKHRSAENIFSCINTGVYYIQFIEKLAWNIPIRVWVCVGGGGVSQSDLHDVLLLYWKLIKDLLALHTREREATFGLRDMNPIVFSTLLFSFSFREQAP